MFAPINTSRRPHAVVKRGAAVLTAAGLAFAGVALTGVSAANAAGSGPVVGTTQWSTPYMTSIVMNLCEGATDAEGDPITLGGMDSALDVHGTFDSYNPSTCMVGWTPDEGFSGPANFSFVLTDGETETYSSGKVIVGENPMPQQPEPPQPGVNTAPVAVDDWYAAQTGVQLAVPNPGALGNDMDPDGDAFSLSGLTQPSHGTLIFNNPGGFFYKSDAGFVGTDSFSYRIIDTNGAYSNWATVSIEVTLGNQAPVVPDRTYYVEKDTPLYLGEDWKTVQLLDGVTDADGDPLTVGSFVFPLGGVMGGETLNTWGGVWRYTPPTGFTGTRPIKYAVSDGTHFTFAMINFVVTEANEAPVAIDDAYTVQEGSTLVVSAMEGLLANDVDPNGDAIEFASSYAAGHGELNIAADGSFTYTPTAGYYGTDHFSYYAKDSKGAQSTLAEVTIVVTPNPAVNHRPQGIEDTYTGAVQGETFTVDAMAGLVANDLDIDGDQLTIAYYSQTQYGTITSFDYATGAFTYQGDPQSIGMDWFEYVAKDPSGLQTDPVMVWIDVEPNTAELPVAGADEYWVLTNTPLVVAAPHHLLANDSDPNGDDFTVRAYGQPQHGTVTNFVWATGSFTYTPHADFTGTDTMVYSLEDSKGYVTQYFQVVFHVVDVLPAPEPEQPSEPEQPGMPEQPVDPEAPAEGGAEQAPVVEDVESFEIVAADTQPVPAESELIESATDAGEEPVERVDASEEPVRAAAGTSAAAEQSAVTGLPTWALYALAGLGALAAAAIGIVRGLRARSNAERA